MQQKTDNPLHQPINLFEQNFLITTCVVSNKNEQINKENTLRLSNGNPGK